MATAFPVVNATRTFVHAVTKNLADADSIVSIELGVLIGLLVSCLILLTLRCGSHLWGECDQPLLKQYAVEETVNDESDGQEEQHDDKDTANGKKVQNLTTDSRKGEYRSDSESEDDDTKQAARNNAKKAQKLSRKYGGRTNPV